MQEPSVKLRQELWTAAYGPWGALQGSWNDTGEDNDPALDRTAWQAWWDRIASWITPRVR